MENIKSLLQKVQHLIALDKQRKEEARKRGEKYNIFSVLGLENSEVRTHSAFLASLLNPDGNHGVGCAFLNAFVSDMNLDELQLDTNNSQVTVEHVTGDGRIDILISDNNKKAIIIENKIYAGDQLEQLKRYDDYAKLRFTNGYRLLYLTLDGHKPSEDSTKGLKDNQYFRLAYNNNLNTSDEDTSDSNNVIRQDIIHWLEECVKIAYNKPLVRETIIQYQSLIKSLTGMNSENETKQEIIKLFATKENYETAALIADNIRGIKKHLVYSIVKPALAAKLPQNCSLLRFDYDEGNWSGIRISVDGWEKARIAFEFEKGGNTYLIYGISWPNGRPKSFVLPSFKKNDHWIWRDVKKYYNWDTRTFIDIFNGNVCEMFIDCINELLDLTDGKEEFL